MKKTLKYLEQSEVNRNLIGEGVLRLATEDDLEFVSQGMYNFEIDTGLNASPDKQKCYE